MFYPLFEDVGRWLFRPHYTRDSGPEWRRKAKANGTYYKEGRATFVPTEPARTSRQRLRRAEIVEARKLASDRRDWRSVRAALTTTAEAAQ